MTKRRSDTPNVDRLVRVVLEAVISFVLGFTVTIFVAVVVGLAVLVVRW